MLAHTTVPLWYYFLYEYFSSMADYPCKIKIISTLSCHGGNYLEEEEIATTRAYICVSTDTIVGSGQVKGTH